MKKDRKKPRPQLLVPTANDIGEIGERNLNKALGGVLTPGSGKGVMKGDVMHGYSREGRTRARGYKRMIEKKSTQFKSMKLDSAWLCKIEKQAFEAGKEPVLVIEFETLSDSSTQWGMVPIEKLREYFELEDEYGLDI